MNPYYIRQLDADGAVLSEKQVEAHAYDAVLRQLRSKDVLESAERIEVYRHDGDRAGEINVDFWRRTVRRK